MTTSTAGAVATSEDRQSFLAQEAASWLRWDPNPHTKAAVETAVQQGDTAALEAFFGSGRLEFGTAGLRAKMGPGNACMNDLTVIQTTQGLAAVLEEDFGDEGKGRGVVIGYDHRAEPSLSLSSEGFALAAASVLLHRGFKVLLFRGLVPTPLVPFAIKHHGACAGVMVTASHNPRQDDGYKLYWNDGVQIISPIDKRVATAIRSCLAPWVTTPSYRYDEATVRSHPSCLDLTAETLQAYMQQITLRLCRFPADNERLSAAPWAVVYTPMHGVGHPFASQAFKAFHLAPYTPVPSQQEPDPAFPTVRFPNPEEKGALAEACAVADRVGARLVLANDPDADRMAVAEKEEDGGQWHVFTGNELGTILGCWQWELFKQRQQQEGGDAKEKTAAVVASTVSSKMLRAVAKAEGFEFHETLTGFKWLGHKALELLSEGKEVLLAYEEAIGYCLGADVVADKDGVSAVAVTAEMALQLRESRGGQTLRGYLASLHAKYGEFASCNHYYFLPPTDTAEVAARIFDRLRNGGKYLEAVGGYKITAVRDLTSPGYDSSTPDHRPTLPVSSGTQMLTFTFENGCELTLRTSGTEPKLKYYSEMQGKPGVPLEQVQAELHTMLTQTVLPQLLEPDKHGLTVSK